MIDIKKLKEEALKEIADIEDLPTLEEKRLFYLSRKGEIQKLMLAMKEIPREDKPSYGQKVNELKSLISEELAKKQEILTSFAMNEKLKNEKIDLTLDSYTPALGSLHPLTLITEQLEDAFVGLGYSIAEGPEVELDLYNFERANIPYDHPARDMQDTFYINPTTLLRTHTTAIQMRVLEASADKMPIKLLCPGKVYRRDDDDATHSHQFMQAEGLVVGEGITLADLKGTLEFMIGTLFKEGTPLRFRPSYFPFTEPSFEVDMGCHVCGGKGCNVCKGPGWIEILGSGMVHPHVLEMAGIDSKKYTGFAFGVGLERIAMLKYGISDIRDLYTNDIRFLKDFKRF